MSQHLSCIRLKYTNPISEHFNSTEHTISDFKFFALWNNPKWSDSKRKLIENKWISRLNTLKPNGINTDLNVNEIKFVTLPFKGRSSVPSSLSKILDNNVKASFTTGSPLRVSFNHKHNIARQ
jgi:hypothetical protein